MNLESIKTFLSDRRAVSPVLGVALLIAITVILAGVIGFVVLGVNAGNADGPSSSLKFEQNGTDVTLLHTGGDPIKDANVVLRGDATGTLGQDMSTGDDVLLGTFTSGDQIRVVWQDPSSDREVLLAQYTVE